MCWVGSCWEYCIYEYIPSKYKVRNPTTVYLFVTYSELHTEYTRIYVQHDTTGPETGLTRRENLLEPSTMLQNSIE